MLKFGCSEKDLGMRKLDFGKNLGRLKIGECYFEWGWWYFGKDLERLKTGECYFEWDWWYFGMGFGSWVSLRNSEASFECLLRTWR